jgi:hypothetical protein
MLAARPFAATNASSAFTAGIWHARPSPKLTRAIFAAKTKGRVVDASKYRTDRNADDGLIEDWTVLETLGAALKSLPGVYA